MASKRGLGLPATGASLAEIRETLRLLGRRRRALGGRLVAPAAAARAATRLLLRLLRAVLTVLGLHRRGFLLVLFATQLRVGQMDPRSRLGLAVGALLLECGRLAVGRSGGSGLSPAPPAARATARLLLRLRRCFSVGGGRLGFLLRHPFRLHLRLELLRTLRLLRGLGLRLGHATLLDRRLAGRLLSLAFSRDRVVGLGGAAEQRRVGNTVQDTLDPDLRLLPHEAGGVADDHGEAVELAYARVDVV